MKALRIVVVGFFAGVVTSGAIVAGVAGRRFDLLWLGFSIAFLLWVALIVAILEYGRSTR